MTEGHCVYCSYTPRSRTDLIPGLDLSDIQRLGQQEVAQGLLQARTYVGYVLHMVPTILTGHPILSVAQKVSIGRAKREGTRERQMAGERVRDIQRERRGGLRCCRTW